MVSIKNILTNWYKALCGENPVYCNVVSEESGSDPSQRLLLKNGLDITSKCNIMREMTGVYQPE